MVNIKKMALVKILAIAFYFTCLSSTKTVQGVKPHFISEPAKVMEAYQEETVNFTWKLSNHSFDTFYFGTWSAAHSLLKHHILSLTWNNSDVIIHTRLKEAVKEYAGRVRWVGNLSMGVASFELSNIKKADQNYYGVEIGFEDEDMTELTGFSQLVVKARSVFTFAPSSITQAARGSASFTWRYKLTKDDQISLSTITFGVYKKDIYESLCIIQIKDRVAVASNCLPGMRNTKFTSSTPASRSTFVLDDVRPEDEGVYSVSLRRTDRQIILENKTRLFVRGIKPHFISKPGKVMEAYQEETVNFTWKLSNHSFDTFYFGTGSALGHLEDTIISLIRNDTEISIYTSAKEKVKEFAGRVRWVGDLSMGMASFELSNIKQTDQNYYGVEIEFEDDEMTELTSLTQLIVKAISVFTFASSSITQAARGSASFTWRYKLTEDDQISLSTITFGVYKKDTYTILCIIQIKDKVAVASNCLPGMRNTKFTSSTPASRSTFVLDDVRPEDEGVYSVRLGGTRQNMENKTRLFVRGIKPHFISKPAKVVEAYQEETVNFTWKLSNHSFDTFYFGTGSAYGHLENTIISLIRNDTEISIYTSAKEKVKEFAGRVRWVGDLSMGMASFELSNIKQTDQNYYGVEIDFDDHDMTELVSFTRLVVKTKTSIVVKEKNPCDVKNGGCSHSCSFTAVNKTRTCKCPDNGLKLSPDGRTCVSVASVPSSVATVSTVSTVSTDPATDVTATTSSGANRNINNGRTVLKGFFLVAAVVLIIMQ